MSDSDSEHSGASMIEDGVRAPLTDEETKIVEAMLDAFKATDSAYCCSGHVPVGVARPGVFYAITPATFATEWTKGETPVLTGILDFTNPEADYGRFHNMCTPAIRGHGMDDNTSQFAREIRSNAFGLNFDPLQFSNGILSSISRLIDTPIAAKLYKINSYSLEGMSKAHQEAPPQENHLGMLVVTLPNPFEGGGFILRKSGEEQILDWSTSGRKDHPHDLHWVFFSAGIEHEIQSVTTGYCLTLSYHIFGVRKSGDKTSTPETEDENEDGEVVFTLQNEGLPTGNFNFHFKLTPLFSSLVSSYKEPKFLPNGGRLAFGLDHEYGLAGKDKVRFCDDYYKGKDAALVSILKAMGLSYQFKAVYPVDGGNSPPPDNFATTSDEDSILLLWDCFEGVWPLFEDLTGAFEEVGAKADHTLVWVNRPSKYGVACRYAGTGHKPMVHTIDVAAAVIVEIPAFGTTRRNGAFP